MLRPYTWRRFVLVLQHPFQTGLEIVRVDPSARRDRRGRGSDGEPVLDDRFAARERAQRDLVTGRDILGERDALTLNTHLFSRGEPLNRDRNVVQRMDSDRKSTRLN